MDFRLLNGKKKVTAIERFDHSALLIWPDRKTKKTFPNIKDLKKFTDQKGWEINVEHLHAAGSTLRN